MEDLVEAAASDAGWARLWRAIEPMLWELVDRPRFASHLAHTEDARRRIITAIRAQLASDRCRAYLDARQLNPRLSFARWLRTMAKHIAFGYARYRAVPDVRRRASARRFGRYSSGGTA